MKKKFIFALFFALLGFKTTKTIAQTAPYSSSLGGFSSTDTALVWSHGDEVSYSLITLENNSANTIDIGFVWDTISPFPSLWGAEIEYPLSGGYTSAKSGQFRLFNNGGASVPLIFFAFSHNNQTATGAVNLHLYQINQPNDSLNVRFEMTSRPHHPIAVSKLSDEAMQSQPLYQIQPHPIQNQLFLSKKNTEYIPNVDTNKWQAVNIYIFSAAGELVFTTTGSIDENMLMVDIQNLSTGVYTLQIQCGQFNQISPLVKIE